MILLKASAPHNIDELKARLQDAIALEHATIPPYLTAWWTLSGVGPGAVYARKILRGIVIQEMQHLQIAANILNAIGGAPVLQGAGFVPQYPGPLPEGIGLEDSPTGLTVGLVRYSRATVRDVFMSIEQPEHPVDIPVAKAALAEFAPQYQTIGEFYQAIREEIGQEGDAIFTGDPARQVTDGEVPPVTNVASAQAAIDLIVQQGEGTAKSVLNPAGRPAHFYLFESLVKGMQLNVGADGIVTFDPNKPVAVDDTLDVIQMADNPGGVDLAGSPAAGPLSDAFDAAYSQLLRSLHATFNGSPASLDDAVNIQMGDLTDKATALLQQPIMSGPQKGLFAGPRFQWVDS